jgi:hypothetical protein
MSLHEEALAHWGSVAPKTNINPLTPKLNPSVQRCLPTYLLGMLMFKGLNARRVYKSFGVKRLSN